MDIRKLQRAIVDGLEDVKAQNIAVFNTEHLSPLFERVIIASGTSNRQTKALANSVRETVKSRGMQVLRTEGEDNGEWIIVDCGAAVAHIMQPAIRDYYHLEEIWGGKNVRMKLAVAGGVAKPNQSTAVSSATARAPAQDRLAPAKPAAHKAPTTRRAAAPARGAAAAAPKARKTAGTAARVGKTTGPASGTRRAQRHGRPAQACCAQAHDAVKLLVVAIGQRQPAWADAAWADFAKRFPPEMRLELRALKAEPRQSRTAAQCLAAEAARIEAACPKGAHRVALDEHGARCTTLQLADRMRSWRGAGGDVAFLIGGPDGLNPALKAGADAALRLSDLTLPHAFVRVLLAEALYRAWSVIEGHPYHRD